MSARWLRTKHRAPAFTPSVMQLEDRWMLAGDVSVSVDAGNLVITGDEANNAVAVYRTLRSDSFRVVGTGGTTINGEPGPLVISGVSGDFDISLGEGNDRLRMYALRVPGDLLVDSGTTDDGDDSIHLFAVRVRGDLDFATGDGNDFVYMAAVWVDGDAFIDMLGGDDNLRIHASRFEGNVAISMGEGDDTLRIVASRFAEAVDINMGSGDDDLGIVASRFSGDVNIQMGAGADRLVLVASAFDGGLTADGGDGDDTLFKRAIRATSPVFDFETIV